MNSLTLKKTSEKSTSVIISKYCINTESSCSENNDVDHVSEDVHTSLDGQIKLSVDRILYGRSQWPRSKAWNVFARSNAEIVGSNPTQGMDVCLRLFRVCVVLCRQRPCVGLIPRPRSPTDCLRLMNWNESKRFTDALRSKWEQQEWMDGWMDGWMDRQTQFLTTNPNELFFIWTLSNSDSSNDLLCPFITPRRGPRRKHSLSIVEKACLLIRCSAMDVLLLRALTPAVMRLLSRCLAMGLYVTIYST
jgi:hypothetical protein